MVLHEIKACRTLPIIRLELFSDYCLIALAWEETFHFQDIYFDPASIKAFELSVKLLLNSKIVATVWSIFGVGPDSDLDALRPLASHSLLLLLILSNQLTKDRNPYRDILFNCKGQSAALKDDEFRQRQNGEVMN